LATIQSCVWTGASGKSYTYQVFDNPPHFKPNQDGNYIYAKVVNNMWVPIYIGEGSLSDGCYAGHHQAPCIAQEGATHVHAHFNGDEANRKAEEEDLLARYTIAYAPAAECTITSGG
jgi:hypothetical protein